MLLVKKRSRNNLDNCTKGSDSTRKQRQLKCGMVSRLTTIRHVKTCSRDHIQADNHTISNYMYTQKTDVSGMRPGSIRRERETCKSNQMTKDNYLNGINSINCFDSKRDHLPLHTCAETSDCSELFDFFLSLGSQVLIRSDLIDTDLLIIPCRSCNLHLVKRMVDLGFDVESLVKGNNRTSILSAARAGCYEVVVYLHQIGCDITASDKHKNNILQLAVRGKNPSVINFILALNLSRVILEGTDKGHNTPLLFGAKYNALKAVKVLVENGCNMCARSSHGETALHLATRYGHLDIVQYTVSLKVLHTNCRDNSGKTPLQLVMKMCASKRPYMRRKCHEEYLGKIKI